MQLKFIRGNIDLVRGQCFSSKFIFAAHKFVWNIGIDYVLAKFASDTVCVCVCKCGTIFNENLWLLITDIQYTPRMHHVADHMFKFGNRIWPMASSRWRSREHAFCSFHTHTDLVITLGSTTFVYLVHHFNAIRWPNIYLALFDHRSISPCHPISFLRWIIATIIRIYIVKSETKPSWKEWDWAKNTALNRL